MKLLTLFLFLASSFAASAMPFHYKVRTSSFFDCDQAYSCVVSSKVEEVSVDFDQVHPAQFQSSEVHGDFYFGHSVTVRPGIGEPGIDVTAFTAVSDMNSNAYTDSYVYNVVADETQLGHFGTITATIDVNGKKGYSGIDIYNVNANVKALSPAEAKEKWANLQRMKLKKPGN